MRLLEASRIGSGASGRSGGQLLPGFGVEHDALAAIVGPAPARALWQLSVDALVLLRRRVADLGIDCDLRPGHVQAALRQSQLRALEHWHATLETGLDYRGTRLLDAGALAGHVASPRYIGGLLDPNAGHLDPLRLARGLAHGAEAAGVVIHEHTPALGHERRDGRLRVRTPHGSVSCSELLLAGHGSVAALAPRLARRILPVATYVVATEPLGAQRAAALLPTRAAVADCNWVLDYFRLARDDRLLFGGRVSYSGLNPRGIDGPMRQRLLRVFPSLGDVRITHAWGGLIDITVNRAPDFGRVAPDTWYVQGFSGHGIALAGLAGHVAAEAMTGTADRFDLFARIPHREFPGGAALRRPLLVLAMLWYRLRDLR